MASKMTTNVIALYLTFNFVFLGFAAAQPPVAQPLVCPISLRELGVCVDLFGLVAIIINPTRLARCCDLLAGVGAPRASICACDAARISILGLLNINARVDRLLSRCPASIRPPNGVNCN
ncbi:unnamed protein product [Cochlearia groenlandica]